MPEISTRGKGTRIGKMTMISVVNSVTLTLNLSSLTSVHERIVDSLVMKNTIRVKIAVHSLTLPVSVVESLLFANSSILRF